MKISMVALAMVFCTSLNLLAQESYNNPAYGIKVQATGDWKFDYKAKLEVDLHSLTDPQLTELFDSYRSKGIVMLKQEGHGATSWIRISLRPGRSRASENVVQRVIRLVKSLEKEMKEMEKNFVPPNILTISDAPAVHVAYSMPKPPGVEQAATRMDQYIIPRSRSAVLVECVTPEEASSADIHEIHRMIETMTIDIDADKLLVQ